MNANGARFAFILLGTLFAGSARGDPPSHVSIGGLCDLAADLRGAPDRWIQGVLPAGDMDGDGKEDILIRDIPSEIGLLPDDNVVLLYGQPFQGPELDIYDARLRRTVIITGEWAPAHRRRDQTLNLVFRLVGMAEMSSQEGTHFTSPDFLEGLAGSAGDFDGDGWGDAFFAGPGFLVQGALAILYGGPAMFEGGTVPLDGGFFADSRGLYLVGGCLDAMDVDDKGTLEITDAILLLEFLFLSGKPPAAPFPGPGADPTPDGLPCKG